ncbi:MAG: IS1595 family transposase, partial [Nitrosomonas sp.]
MNTNFNTIIDLIRAFPNEQTCVDHLESLRWNNGSIVSPFDPDSKVYKCANNRYRCKNTGKYFNVKTATLFDNSKVELQKWFLAIWLVTSHKKGISSVQLSKDIGVTQKTSWFMLQRIRNCFGSVNDNDLSNEVEVD